MDEMCEVDAPGDAPSCTVDAPGAPAFICRSTSAFSSSDIIVVATEVMSFMIEISPIYGRTRREGILGRGESGRSYIIDEALAAEHVGEEPGGVFHVDRALFVHLSSGDAGQSSGFEQQKARMACTAGGDVPSSSHSYRTPRAGSIMQRQSKSV